MDAAVEQAAKALGDRSGQTVTPGQVLLKWAAQKGDISVTTSGKVRQRFRPNAWTWQRWLIWRDRNTV